VRVGGESWSPVRLLGEGGRGVLVAVRVAGEGGRGLRRGEFC